MGWLHTFVTYATEPKTQSTYDLDEGFLRIGINIDHETDDRGGLQGVRMLHPHCLCFPRQMAPVRKQQLHFDRPDSALVSIIDPLSKLGPAIIADACDAGLLPASIDELCQVTDKGDPGMPLAFNLKLRDSWDSLLDPVAGQAIAELDTALLGLYQQIRQTITGADPAERFEPWERPPILPATIAAKDIAKLSFLSQESQAGLNTLAASLRTIPPRVMDRLRAARAPGAVTAAEKILTFAGLTYGLTFYSPGTIGGLRHEEDWTQPAYLAIQPALMRTSGVAGFNFDADGQFFKIVRGKETPEMTPSQLAARREFQTGYAQAVGRHSLRGIDSPSED